MISFHQLDEMARLATAQMAVKAFLEKHPNATIREISYGTGIVESNIRAIIIKLDLNVNKRVRGSDSEMTTRAIKHVMSQPPYTVTAKQLAALTGLHISNIYKMSDRLDLPLAGNEHRQVSRERNRALYLAKKQAKTTPE